MAQQTGLSGVGLDVRRYDRERFVTALFCPAAVRDDVMATLGFNTELARIRALIREPLAGEIRLQWWRELLEGERPGDEIARHPIAQPLTALVAAGRLDKAALMGMIDARERDVASEGFDSIAELTAYAWATSGALARSMASLLGATDEDSLVAAQEAATAYALVGMLRSLRFHLAVGWMTLPHDALDRAHLAPEMVKEGTDLTPIAREVADHAGRLLARARARKIAPKVIPACLTGTLAGGHLKTLRRTGWNLFDPALATPKTMPVRLMLHALAKRF